jgi:AcrR family transcriptional regulator
MAKSAAPKKTSGREKSPRSALKRQAILNAATEIFLKGGYLGTSMEEIATLSAVSKQTVYKHFASKEALFIAVVSGMTDDTGNIVRNAVAELDDGGDVAEYLVNYAYRQLTGVLTPRVMQLRRLVIGEVSRFPDLAKVLYERGPMRAVAALAAVFEHLADRRVLVIEDPWAAATHFNWLIMADPLNRAMLLGDAAIPKQAELRRHAAEGVRIFLAAYGRK